MPRKANDSGVPDPTLPNPGLQAPDGSDPAGGARRGRPLTPLWAADYDFISLLRFATSHG
jgi:hypothetical protein